jgi:hypothetical protein
VVYLLRVLIKESNTNPMTTEHVAKRFYELAIEGKWDIVLDDLFSKDAASIEPAHAQGLKSVKGLDAIREKGKQWGEAIEEMHGGYTNAPIVAGNYFACAMGVDVTMKGRPRTKIDEIALYEVKDGKIVSEQFFY